MLLGLVLILVLLLWSLDFGDWLRSQVSWKPEKGGKLIIGKGASQQFPPSPAKEASKDLPKREELTFYQTLTQKKENNSSRADFKPRVIAPGAKVKLSKPHALKNTGSASGVNDRTGRGDVGGQRPQGPLQMTERHYTLQVGSFLDRDSARKLVERLLGRGYAAYLMKAMLADRKVGYRVRVGSFSDKTQAKATAEQLEKQEGLNSFIVYVSKGVQ